MAHLIFCMSCCVRGDRIKSVPSIDQTARWHCWEPLLESLSPMRIRLMGWESGGMLTTTCCYFCLQRPRCPNSLYLEIQMFGGNFLGWHCCSSKPFPEVAVLYQRDRQSEEWIRIPPNRAARHESQMDGNRWLALLGTRSIILVLLWSIVYI